MHARLRQVSMQLPPGHHWDGFPKFLWATALTMTDYGDFRLTFSSGGGPQRFASRSLLNCSLRGVFLWPRRPPV